MTYSSLAEVVFEIRFEPKDNFSTSLLMEINKIFPDSKDIIQKEGLQFPNEVKNKHKKLYFTPSYQIVYTDFILFIADGCIIIIIDTKKTNYPGWKEFKNKPIKLFELLNKLQELNIQRYSLRYTNFIQNDIDNSKSIDINIFLGKQQLNCKNSLHLKSQIPDDNDIILIDIISNATATVKTDENQESKTEGTVFTIDAIHNSSNKNKNDFIQSLDDLHKKISNQYNNIYTEGENT